jgi:hypothetical protein
VFDIVSWSSKPRRNYSTARLRTFSLKVDRNFILVGAALHDVG